jgi:hypothetical protein
MGFHPMPRNTFLSIQKSIQKKSCFPKDSFLKDNPELHFNPGAADKWIQLLGILRMGYHHLCFSDWV